MAGTAILLGKLVDGTAAGVYVCAATVEAAERRRAEESFIGEEENVSCLERRAQNADG